MMSICPSVSQPVTHVFEIAYIDIETTFKIPALYVCLCVCVCVCVACELLYSYGGSRLC